MNKYIVAVILIFTMNDFFAQKNDDSDCNKLFDKGLEFSG